MARLKDDCPESIRTAVVWLDGYIAAAHGQDSVAYFSLIRRALRAYEADLRARSEMTTYKVRVG